MVGDIVELLVVLNAEVFACLLHLSKYLLGLRWQNLLIQLLPLLYLCLFLNFVSNQFFIQLLPIFLFL